MSVDPTTLPSAPPKPFGNEIEGEQAFTLKQREEKQDPLDELADWITKLEEQHSTVMLKELKEGNRLTPLGIEYSSNIENCQAVAKKLLEEKQKPSNDHKSLTAEDLRGIRKAAELLARAKKLNCVKSSKKSRCC